MSYTPDWAQEALKAEGQLMRLALTSRDCAALMPGGGLDANARVKALEAELAHLDTDMAETEAQHRLYTLLQERTRHAPASWYAAKPALMSNVLSVRD